MQIRQATLEDLSLLVRLNASVQTLHAQARPDVFKMPGEDAAMTDFYLELLQNPDVVIYVVEVNNIAVGYAVAVIQRRPETPFTFVREQISLDQISVEPAYQGKGYGQALTQAVLDRAREQKIRYVTLGVWDFNASAIGFYEKLGFKMQQHRMEFLLD